MQRLRHLRGCQVVRYGVYVPPYKENLIPDLSFFCETWPDIGSIIHVETLATAIL